MKSWMMNEDVSAGILFFAVCIGFFISFICLLADGGLAATPATLGRFGYNETITCEWKASDKQEAIFVDESGERRLINVASFGHSRANVEIGKKYRMNARMLHRYAQQVYLVPA